MFGSMRGPEDGAHKCGRGRRHAEAEMWAMGGGFSGRHRGRGPRGGRGFGDDGDGRIGRLLIRGDLRLVILALIEHEARHGYELIKQIEDMTGGFYAPSPGVVYPTLTYLDEAGYVRAEEEANKKRYSITEEGKAYLEENRKLVGEIFDRLAAIGERAERRKARREGRFEERGPELPRSLDAALLHLRETIARKIKADETKAGEIVRVVLGIADDLDAE